MTPFRPTLAQWLVSQCVDRGFGVPPGSYREPEEVFAWMWRQIEGTTVEAADNETPEQRARAFFDSVPEPEGTIEEVIAQARRDAAERMVPGITEEAVGVSATRRQRGEGSPSPHTQTGNTMTVHNHGPAEGRGLDCPEKLIDGKLKGACLQTNPTDVA